MKHYIQRKRQEEGFTLIELLIVIVVIGVLAGIVLFGTAQFRGDSVAACNDANTRIVASASAAYRAKNGGTGPVPVTTLQSSGYIETLPTCAT
jgi:prepilin-type N-terminal cleavage/methylation domain-containing protein